MIARSESLITWERLGPIVRGEDSKDHVLFPRQIDGRFAAWPLAVWKICSILSCTGERK